jgi:hypothetical protein
MGVALCPCDGTLSPAEYRPVVERLLHAVDFAPDILLDPLVERVGSFATDQRFEEAAWARDRHRAVVRALERRRIWRSLQAAGRIEVESGGETAVIDGGRFVAAWAGTETPLIAPTVDDVTCDVAPSILAQEEADLIWKWVTSGEAHLAEVSGVLGLPTRPVQSLDRLDDSVVSLSPLAAPASSRR